MSTEESGIMGAALLYHERPDEKSQVELSAETANELSQIVSSINKKIGHDILTEDDVVRLSLGVLNGDIELNGQRDADQYPIGPLVSHINGVTQTRASDD